MHAALHCREHKLQLWHLSGSMRTFSKEYFDINPSTVPTGHIVLQYARPFFHASMAMIIKEPTVTMNVDKLFIHTSVW